MYIYSQERRVRESSALCWWKKSLFKIESNPLKFMPSIILVVSGFCLLVDPRDPLRATMNSWSTSRYCSRFIEWVPPLPQLLLSIIARSDKVGIATINDREQRFNHRRSLLVCRQHLNRQKAGSNLITGIQMLLKVFEALAWHVPDSRSHLPWLITRSESGLSTRYQASPNPSHILFSESDAAGRVLIELIIIAAIY